MKIGIFGGTFDPIHNEHTNICLSAKKEFELDKIIVLPAGIPPHKKTKSLSAEKYHRLEMAKLAFCNNQDITVSDYEIKKEEPSYSYLTLRYFKELYPDDKLYFIIGADSIIDFETWKNPKEILSLCTLTVCGREGYDDYLKYVDNIEKKFDTKLLVCRYKGALLSSTAVKVFLEFKMDCSNIIDDKVANYIRENNLYNNYGFYIEKLKEMLSEKRYIHTVHTVIMALKLARKTGCGEEKTFLAAALHDCTKKLSDEKLKEMGFVLTSIVPEPVAHSVSGSFIARTVFNIKDKDIINSIRYHTTGRPKMSLLEKVIYVADCIEATRDYEGVEILRKKVDEDFQKGFLACMELTIQQLKVKENRQEVSDMTMKAFEYYKENNKILE